MYSLNYGLIKLLMRNGLSEKEVIIHMEDLKIFLDRAAWKPIRFMMLKFLKRKVIMLGLK